MITCTFQQHVLVKSFSLGSIFEYTVLRSNPDYPAYRLCLKFQVPQTALSYFFGALLLPRSPLKFLRSLLDMSKYKGVIGEISLKSGHEIEWSIDNFCSYRSKDEDYCSPDFRMSDSEWKLQVYPNGETAKNSGGWISLYLLRVQDGSPQIGAWFTFGVKKVDGSVEQIGSKLTWVFEEDKEGFGYGKFLKRSVMMKRESEMLPSKSLTLTCTLWTGKHLEPYGSMDVLSRNLSDLFISKRDSDATLVVKGKKFSVHKLILSARSPVLAALFETDMKEKKTGIVEIPELDPETFKVFLAYLYSGKIEDVSCDAFELTKIADKYGVEDLKSYCLVLIMTSLSLENVLDAAVLGNLFDESGLMLKIHSFFNKNYKEIISTSVWDEFLSENMTVANKLLKDMVKN